MRQNVRKYKEIQLPDPLVSWDFYAQAFNERYQKLEEGEAKEMALAAFVVNAARVSLVAGVPCEGQEGCKSPSPFTNSAILSIEKPIPGY